MAQLTIYLDADTESAAKSAAAAENMPVSRWIAAAIRKQVARVWPADVAALAGAWQDCPTAESLRLAGDDTPRETL